MNAKSSRLSIERPPDLKRFAAIFKLAQLCPRFVASLSCVVSKYTTINIAGYVGVLSEASLNSSQKSLTMHERRRLPEMKCRHNIIYIYIYIYIYLYISEYTLSFIPLISG